MKITLLLLSLLVSTSVSAAESSIDVNFGLSASKSVLGLSYTNGRNQLNAGLRGFAYNSRDGLLLQPGIAYNRYLTENGFYAAAIYLAKYYSQDVKEYSFWNIANGIEPETEVEKGWHSDLIMAGLGKSFQFTHWGIHLDGGVATNADSNFGTAWGLWFGGGFSYRFRLD
jgi:hypothetical protein